MGSCISKDDDKPDINIKSKIDNNIECECGSSCCISNRKRSHSHNKHKKEVSNHR